VRSKEGLEGLTREEDLSKGDDMLKEKSWLMVVEIPS